MRSTRIILAAAIALLASGSMVNSAHAACAALAGTWYIYDLYGESPAIASKSEQVVTGPTIGDTKNINVFADAAPFNNRTAAALDCEARVQASGAASVQCFELETDVTLIVDSASGTGQLGLNSKCTLSGRFNMDGDPTPLIITSGHINGNIGGGIAHHGTQVQLFIIVKK